jgi:hypothetical protein
MKNQLTAKNRKELKNKMALVFNENIQRLSPDLQDVLLDDLVTALENRIIILNKVHQNMKCVTVITESAEFETIQT